MILIWHIGKLNCHKRAYSEVCQTAAISLMQRYAGDVAVMHREVGKERQGRREGRGGMEGEGGGDMTKYTSSF